MHYQLIFVVNFMVCYLIMKLVSFRISHRGVSFKDFFQYPYVSTRSLRYRDPRKNDHIVADFFTFSLFLFFCIITARQFQPLEFWQVWLFAPALYFFTEVLGFSGQIVFLGFHEDTFAIHLEPYRSKTLAEFWGRRWNLWIQDWLKDIGSLAPKSRTRRMVLIFFVSGFFHEAMVNLPYYLITGESYFGTMIAYFLIQALALWIEKRFLRRGPAWVHRLYLWSAVILPSPLFINVPLLRFLGLT
jgi:hypothetical protein